ncbi:hypothetical protein [Pontibacter litorisediminis]|uniref:hypothetical protein n=1 Tax=Pontibacter litorisediminis TaxID=1846260 RepID=UPI0023EC79B9|nr:hypothetical protein [Pontibacter litorisediminis]
MNLEDLSNTEFALLEQVRQVHALMGDKPKMVDAIGVFDKYINIHKRYAELANDDNEALKRALFLQWYAVSEPSGLTGIPGGQGPFDGEKELDKEAEERVLQLINQKIEEHQLDEELKWMLSYYGYWDYYFEQFNNIDYIIKYIKTQEYHAPENVDLKKFENRGQLGVYWKSILDNKL